jgi:hypothetical protein
MQPPPRREARDIPLNRTDAVNAHFEIWVDREGRLETLEATYELSVAGASAASNDVERLTKTSGVTVVTWKRLDESGDHIERASPGPAAKKGS